MCTMNKRVDPGFWVGLLIFILMLFTATRCSATNAKIDTVECNNACIIKLVQINKEKSTKIYVVYVDKKRGINDLIPMSKTAYEYYSTCRRNNIEPSLGLKLRDGYIVSIVKRKKRYVRH